MWAAVIVLTVAVLAVWGARSSGLTGPGGYTVRVVLPEAIGLYAGTPMQINGAAAGEIVSMTTRGDNAIATVAVDASHAPLHAGTTSGVDYRSVLGERYLALAPGPAENPALPDGSLLAAGSSQVTVEDLLEAFDEPTRARLRSLLPELRQTLGGKEDDLNATLAAAGPTVDALGQIMGAVGQDGPAIRELVTNLRGVTDVLSRRRAQLSGSVANLRTVTTAVAAEQRQLGAAVGQLPATLNSASRTLDQFGPTADEVVPLLKDLRPGIAHLPAVAANLRPVLHDLRPAIADLRPTLDSASELLRHTPGFFDAGTGDSGALRPLTSAVSGLEAPLEFLRPYTPELMGWLTNWRTVFGNYDAQGHYTRADVLETDNAFQGSPIPLPGSKFNVMPPPGAIVNQPWVDANGNGMH